MSDREKIDLKNVALHEPKVDSSPGLDVPVHLVELPSEGKVYPKESSMHGLSEVEIRAMTAREEDILTSSTLLKQGKAIGMVISNCLTNNNIDPDDMLVCDRNAVIVNIRVSGYGPDYEAEVQCPQCGNEFQHTFVIDKIMSVKPLSVEPDSPGVNEFSYTLPISKKVVKLKLLTGKEDRELSVSMERAKKANGPFAPTNSVTLRLFQHIVSIDGVTDRKQIRKLVDNMIAGDSRSLRSFIDSISPSLDLSDNVMCPTCGEESEVEMPIGASFFWPDV